MFSKPESAESQSTSILKFIFHKYKLKPKEILLWNPGKLQSNSMLAQLSCKLLKKNNRDLRNNFE